MLLELPDFTDPLQAADSSRYKANIDNAAAVYNPVAGAFHPYAAAIPDMTISVGAGTVQFAIFPITQPIQNTTTIVAPSVNPRIDRAVIDSLTGILSVITGAEAASPLPPALPFGKIAIAQIALQTSTTSISDGLITDERVSSYTTIIDDGTMAANSPVMAPSQRAVKTFVESRHIVNTEVATTSGTTHTLSGIPDWANEVTINFVNVSGTLTSDVYMELQGSGAMETSGYASSVHKHVISTGTAGQQSSRIIVMLGIDSGRPINGSVTFRRSGTSWVHSGKLFATTNMHLSGGSKSVAGDDLTAVRVYLQAGSFDAGAINITWS